MKFQHCAVLWAALSGQVSGLASNLGPREDNAGSSIVNLDSTYGDATFLGSGFIYGFPDNGSDADNSIPDNFLTDIKFRSCRGGGAQIAYEGWALGGLEQYRGRFASALSNYRTTRKHQGTFILMASDLWGAQGGAYDGFPFPGDNGDWSEMEMFLRQIISDIKANNMLDGLIIDLWNEPDLDTFWDREWSQFVEYIVRSTKLFRSEFPEIKLSAPSSANSPSTDSNNWRALFSSLSQNDIAPDYYSWHQIGSWQREPDTTIPALRTLLADYNLKEKPVYVNEYAWPDEQNPANSVFYLAQLERYDITGLRANWGGGSSLHDFMANLVWKDDGGYHPNGEWQVYKYYGEMEGQRVTTSAAADLKFDTFAVRSGNLLKILAGTRSVQNRYDIVVSGFADAGLPETGSLTVQKYQFDWAGNSAIIWDKLDLGTSTYEYSSNKLIIPFDAPTSSTAFAFEIHLA